MFVLVMPRKTTKYGKLHFTNQVLLLVLHLGNRSYGRVLLLIIPQSQLIQTYDLDR